MAPGASTVDLLALLARLPARAPASVQEVNLDLLRQRLDSGARAVRASFMPAGAGPVSGPALFLEFAEPAAEVMLLGLGPETRKLLRSRAGSVPVDGEIPEGLTRSSSGLVAELGRLIASTAALEHELRAAHLMQFIVERVDASRCALVPCEADVPLAPLAFQLRGEPARRIDARRLPRRIIEMVVRTRQPLVSHDAAASASPIPLEDTIERQGIRSFMAVPVVFRGDLLAVAVVDRFDEPRRFSDEEQVAFHVLAHELARPLLSFREAQRRTEYDDLRESLLSAAAPHPLLAASPALERTMERARRLAVATDENLLLLGETGVGKEWLARWIHEASGRKGPFVAVNVSAVPSELFESELMGSERGAFTGAVERQGHAEAAEGGTLFLDEIGDLELPNQVKLLRFLQDRIIRRVGGRTERTASVRVVAATNQALDVLARSGTFRSDLLHRFAAPIVIPPLRERRSEILPLAQAFLDAAARQRGLPRKRLAPASESLLLGHAWPGNVRQLRAAVVEAAALADGPAIEPADLDAVLPAREAAGGGAAVSSATSWREFQEEQAARERDFLASVLATHGGNIDATARALGCPGTSLRNHLRRHGLLER